MSKTMVKVSDVKYDLKNYPRAKIDPDVVAEYEAALKNGARFPPIAVIHDGITLYLVDGAHRLAAHKKLSLDEILADVEPGTQNDAVTRSVGANDKHGHRRTNEDKRKAVLLLLQDTTWQNKGIRAISRQCKVAWGTANDVWQENQTRLHLPKLADRLQREVVRKGKVYSQKTKAKPVVKKVLSIEALSKMVDHMDVARSHLTADGHPELVKQADKFYTDAHKLLANASGAKFQLTKGLSQPLNVYEFKRGDGVKENKEFEKKKLCTHSVSVGLSCGHQCTYCSSPSVLRTHAAYQTIQQTAFCRGNAIVDPKREKEIKDLLKKEKWAEKLKDTDVIQFSTTDDGWSPESRKYNLGHKVMKVLLENTKAQIRVLTKCAEVEKDFALFKQHEGRVIVGLSTGIPPTREKYARILEPNASPLKDRYAALKKAHDLGLRTYGMLCPCFPMFADEKSLTAMFTAVLKSGVEDIWLEPVNPRGRALINSVHALTRAELKKEAAAVEAIKKTAIWSQYTHDLIKTAIAVAKKKQVLGKLHILLYPDGLTDEHDQALRKMGDSIIWLKPGKHPPLPASPTS